MYTSYLSEAISVVAPTTEASGTHRWAVLLAGGEGTRLGELSYSVSGDRRPKQFCSFFGGKSLLSHTRQRIQTLFREENTLFVLNQAHKAHYEMDLAGIASHRKLIQPSNRGTAHAIALSVLEILQRDMDATIAVFPSDHHYLQPPIFRATVDQALRLANEYDDRILMIGAPPRYPEAEYGWIEPGQIVVESETNPVQLVSGFREKPSLLEAQFLQQQGWLWNTFVTIGRGNAFVELFAETIPHVLGMLADLSEKTLSRVYDEIQPMDFSRDILPAVPDRLFVLRDGPSGWTDFGSPRRALKVLDALAGDMLGLRDVNE